MARIVQWMAYNGTSGISENPMNMHDIGLPIFQEIEHLAVIFK